MAVGANSVGEKASFVQNPRTWVYNQDSFFYVEFVYEKVHFLVTTRLFEKSR